MSLLSEFFFRPFYSRPLYLFVLFPTHPLLIFFTFFIHANSFYLLSSSKFILKSTKMVFFTPSNRSWSTHMQYLSLRSRERKHHQKMYESLPISFPDGDLTYLYLNCSFKTWTLHYRVPKGVYLPPPAGAPILKSPIVAKQSSGHSQRVF